MEGVREVGREKKLVSAQIVYIQIRPHRKQQLPFRSVICQEKGQFIWRWEPYKILEYTYESNEHGLLILAHW